MYKLESKANSTADYGHLSLWRFTEGNSDTNIWFIFWSQNFNAKCNGQTGCIEIVCQNKTELLLSAYVVRKIKCINLS